MKKFKFSATRTLFGTAEKIGEGVAYKVQSIGRAFDMQKSSFESDITFDSGSDQCLEEYVVIEYRSYGIRRIPIEFKPLIWYLSGGEEIPLVRYEDVLIDSNDHSLIIKVLFVKLDDAFSATLNEAVSNRKDTHPSDFLTPACCFI